MLKKVRLFLLLLIISLVNISCNRMLVSINAGRDVNKKHIYTYRRDSTSQTVVHIGVAHLGRKGYYESIKKVVDSLRKEGFIIYYEGVNNKGLNEKEKDLYGRKLRRLVGESTSYHSGDKSLPKYYRRYEMQNGHDYGLRKEDVNLDLSVKQLIDSVEKKYGAIILTDCDMQTPLKEKYNCSAKRHKGYYYTARTLRDNHIKDFVKNSEEEKIVIIYGRAHFWSFLPNLYKMGYKLIPTERQKKKKWLLYYTK